VLHRIVAGALVAFVVAACGAQEPPAKPPPAAPAPNDPAIIGKAANACARVSACTRPQDAPRFRDPGTCVEWWVGSESDALRKCLEGANGCEAVSACMHGGGDAKAAAFCAQRQGVVSGCDGDRLVSCGDDNQLEANVTDCAAIGGTCKEVKSAGGLVLRACSSPSKCPAGAPDVRCDGAQTVISCRDGAYERVTCRPGTTCEERRDEAGDALASCELPGRRRCNGVRHCEDDRLVECERGKAKVIDCVGQGLRCAGTGPRAGCYVPANVECDKEMLPKCEAGSVVFCAVGRLEKIACTSLGLGPCDPSAKGPFAACSPAPPPPPAK